MESIMKNNQEYRLENLRKIPTVGTLTEDLKDHIREQSLTTLLRMQQELLNELNKGLLGKEYYSEFNYISECIRIKKPITVVTVTKYNSMCSSSMEMFQYNGENRKQGYVAYFNNFIGLRLIGMSCSFAKTKKEAMANATERQSK
jgi:hypothetical protein